jgi:hypothetical protein
MQENLRFGGRYGFFDMIFRAPIFEFWLGIFESSLEMVMFSVETPPEIHGF